MDLSSHDHCNDPTHAADSNEQIISSLPPDEGHCAMLLLRHEMRKHATTRSELHRTSIRLSDMQSRARHQALVILGWRSAQEGSDARSAQLKTENKLLGDETKRLVAENERLEKEVRSWRQTFPLSPHGIQLEGSGQGLSTGNETHSKICDAS
ncbi:uncharacterized protein K452DRAFT_313578 [Aplosporella prunicola CBS 121167]|uniref:Uncharacterized protein n=1 Tax=Aplosporella prunicola CBS 121167 TaxID=1176127 RepID=A0A6A6AWJ2_9PEZI|nr:uncharacterized protein K452DRAFT_313578 [Aplosporella prunicola CBS 121167]KAF2135966.1 hypothetical protein K452DRAFT_313578 [Aplosporella prunicola CBS 121167]